MKARFFLVLMIFSCSMISLQAQPFREQPLPDSTEQWEERFQNFINQTQDIALSAAEKKEALRSYNDLIEEMDALYHGATPESTQGVSTSVLEKSDLPMIDGKLIGYLWRQDH